MIEVKVRRESDRYIAELFGGWWSATGNTEKDAVRRAVERYEKEMSRLREAAGRG